MVTAYTDGKIMFYKQPNIHLDKDNQPENVADTILNSNVHKGEIYAICSNEEFIAIGGLDNKVSFWKIITGQIITEVNLPIENNVDYNAVLPQWKHQKVIIKTR